MILSSIPYHTAFTIPEGLFSKTGESVNIDQDPPTPIGPGPTFYRCFEVDAKGKKKLAWRWICATTEVTLQK